MPKIGYKQSAEHRQAISRAHSGMVYPAEFGRKVSLAKAGVPNVAIRGSKHVFWKGEKASYSAKHHWVKRFYGLARKCENCGCRRPSGRKWWFEWANISGKYKRVISDWIQLCIPCHRKFDRGNLTLK